MVRERLLILDGGVRGSVLAEFLFRDHGNAWVALTPGPGVSLSDNYETWGLPLDDLDPLLERAREKRISFIVSGSEGPLAAGLRRRAAAYGIEALGPDDDGIALEACKSFGKDFMGRHGIPTAEPWFVAQTLEKAGAIIDDFPDEEMVVKQDGLAAGKGVTVCDTRAQARQAAQSALQKGKVVIEKKIPGRELSFTILTNGLTLLNGEDEWRLMGVCQDYKQFNGLMTGGVGATTVPAWFYNAGLKKKIVERIVKPTLRGLRADGINYRGFIFFGLMIDGNGDPFLLEFNCRLGDPETSVHARRWTKGLLPLMRSAAAGLPFKNLYLKETNVHIASVILMAPGYPGTLRIGSPITGVRRAAAMKGVKVFLGGVGEGLVTAGGRVMAVTCESKESLAAAIEGAYAAERIIEFEGKQVHTAIGGQWFSN